MHVVPQGNTIYFDVDDTLIYWNPLKLDENLEARCRDIKFKLNEIEIEKFVIEENVIELILQKESGCHIVVWSASGSQWAEAVIKALNLEDYVDVVVSKPFQYYDDKKSEEWMPVQRRHFGRIYKS